MRIATTAPRLHLLVCANRRAASPLGAGCGDAGDALFAAFREDVADRGRSTDVWITKTYCLGPCAREGATVASYPKGRIFTEVRVEEARALLAHELASVPAPGGDGR
jgi:(2Fe-2S) ferredoxin